MSASSVAGDAKPKLPACRARERAEEALFPPVSRAARRADLWATC